jgi:hypothetical protein
MSTTAHLGTACDNQTALDHLVVRIATGMLHWANRHDEPRAVKYPRVICRGYYSATGRLSEGAQRRSYWT